MIFTNLIQTNLNTSFIGRNIEYYSFTDSTNDDAFELISNDEANNGTLIITDYQKQGRGRRNNIWESTPGTNLTFSLILKEINKKNLGLFSILSGVAVVKGIKEFTGIDCRLKWPNDIILNNKKIGGILIEAKNTPDNIYLVIGIGLNINQKEIPKELESIASSLIMETLSPIQREPLLAFILNEFEKLYKENTEQWITTWREYCNHLNQKIMLHKDDDLIEGFFINIDDYGNAIVNVNSKKTIISSGVIEIT